MNTIPQHIADKANEMIAKGTKMTFEAICEMYMKSDAKAAKKSTSKSEAAKWASRANVDALGGAANGNSASNWLAEKNRESAIKNLPSSLR